MLDLQPPHGRLCIAATPAALIANLVDTLFRLIGEKPGGRLNIALAGGSGAKLLCTELRRRFVEPAAAMDPAEFFSRTQFFWSDERYVPATHPDSNAAIFLTELLEPLGQPACAYHLLVAGDATDPQADAVAYTHLLREQLGPDMRMDVILLGMGDDAHTASLFPQQPSLHGEQPAVVPANANAYVRPLPIQRVTFNLPLINAARHVWLVVTGAKKADTLRRIWAATNRPAVADAPVLGVNPRPGELVWWTSEDAIPA